MSGVLSKRENINVSVRIRPLNSIELDAQSQAVWTASHNNCVAELAADDLAPGDTYFYDNAFGEECSTQDVYDRVGFQIVESAVAGYNGTVFAYGQTSSGKTHTLMGNVEQPGLTILAVHDVFAQISKTRIAESLVRVSYIEIYNETLQDLLQPDKSAELRILEDKVKGNFVKGLKEVVVTSADRVLELIAEGEANRHFGKTNMNERSSRSHTLFKMIIESRNLGPGSPRRAPREVAGAAGRSPIKEEEWAKNKQPVTWSSLYLIDLAGSERVKKTGATGARLKEGTMINKSLLVLGTVISQLSKGSKPIPFRDSKLTRLLQSSLGGNARTAVVVAISPAERNRAETKGALGFASRTKKIINKAKINQVAEDQSLLSKYRNEIEVLRRQLESTNRTVEEAAGDSAALRESESALRLQQERLAQVNELVLVSTSLGSSAKAEKLKEDMVAAIQGRRRLESVYDYAKQLQTEVIADRSNERAHRRGRSARLMHSPHAHPLMHFSHVFLSCVS
jgi:centromeric protein E